MEIQGYPDYLVYNDGRVYSNKTKRFLKSSSNKDGYKYVDLYSNSKRRTYRIHRLVALHYLPNPNEWQEVDHIDRNASNNHVDNLRWASRSMNELNKGVSPRNKLGIKNIIYEPNRKKYTFVAIIDWLATGWPSRP